MSYIPQPVLTDPYPSYQSHITGMKGCMDNRACKMKVEGKGTIAVQPDMATVVLGVITENKQLRQAQEENARIVTNIINTLTGMGIAPRDIQTQSYTIEPQYDYIEGKQVFRGYRVVHSLKIIVRDISKIGEIIDAAVASGANIVNSISFTVSDPSKYYQQALKAAIDDAYTKAATIGNRLGVSVYQIPVSIVEESYAAPPTPFIAQAAAPVTPIQPGQIEITARIEAIFAYSYS